MWYIIQARFHGSDEDDLYVCEGDNLDEVIDELDEDMRDATGLTLCEACQAAGDRTERNDAAERCPCFTCVPFYINNTLECDTEPRSV